MNEVTITRERFKDVYGDFTATVTTQNNEIFIKIRAPSKSALNKHVKAITETLQNL